MEYQHRLLIATGVLAVVAIYITLTLPAEAPGPDSGEAEELLLRSSGFGKGLGDYIYSYSEVSDGYPTSYTLVNREDARKAEVHNPLSAKRIYISEEDVMLCISYPTGEEEICSSVMLIADMQNYVDSIESSFYLSGNILRAESNIARLLDSGYLKVMPDIEEDVVSGVRCRRISYTIDYSNLTLDEAARFGISSSSPRVFHLSACIDNRTGMVWESVLEYTDNKGIGHGRTLTVSSFSETAVPEISAPEPYGDAVEVFKREREQQVKLATCHTDLRGDDREKCIADLSLILKRKDLCELSGSRRDRCLVSLVPMTKDETICPTVESPAFRDDCYIELAGAHKDSSYCLNIQDPGKIEQCERAAIPRERVDDGFDINTLLEQVDKYQDDEEGDAAGE